MAGDRDPSSSSSESAQRSAKDIPTAARDRRRRSLAALALLFAAIVWGCSYVVAKDVLTTVDPFSYLFIRFAVAVPIVACLFARPVVEWLHRSPQAKEGPQRGVVALVTPGLFLFAAFALQAHGLRHSSPAVAAFLTSLVFLFVPMLESLFGHRGNLRRIVLPVALAAVGSFLLSDAWHSRITMANLLLILCAIAYAAQIFFSGKASARNHQSVTFVVQGSVVALCCLPMVDWASVARVINVPALSIRMSYLVCVATIATYLIQFWCQRYVAPRFVGLIYAAEPVVAFGMSTLLGYEVLSVTALVGSTLILVAVIMSVVTASRESVMEQSDVNS